MAKRKDDVISVAIFSKWCQSYSPCFCREDTLQGLLRSFCQFLLALVDNINVPFPICCYVRRSSCLMINYYLPPPNDLAGYGNQQIRKLLKHFGEHALEKRGIITEDAMTEWLICRPLMSNEFQKSLWWN